MDPTLETADVPTDDSPFAAPFMSPRPTLPTVEPRPDEISKSEIMRQGEMLTFRCTLDRVAKATSDIPDCVTDPLSCMSASSS